MADLRELVERVREARKAQPGCQCADGNSVCMRCHTLFESERACLDALLTSRAVEAVEVLVRLGEARAKRLGLANATVNSAEEYRANQAAWERADEAVWDATCAMSRLADALAGEVDRG